MNNDYLSSLSPEELDKKKREARAAMALNGAPEASAPKEEPETAPVKKPVASLAPEIEKTEKENFIFTPPVTKEKEIPPVKYEVPRSLATEFEDNYSRTNLNKKEEGNFSPLAQTGDIVYESRNAVFNWSEKENEKLSGSRERRLFFLLGAAALIVLSLAALVFVFLRNKNNDKITLPIERFSSILAADSEKTIILEDKTKSSSLLAETLKALSLKKGEVGRITPFLSEEKKKTEMQTTQFFEYAGIALPEKLSRSAAKQFAYGQYQDENPAAFIAIKIEKGEVSYQNAFIGMKEWEKTMPSDLTKILDIKKIAERPVWEDGYIKNIPVRTFGEASDPVLIWSFVNKETALIATSIKSFEAAAGRLSF